MDEDAASGYLPRAPLALIAGAIGIGDLACAIRQVGLEAALIDRATGIGHLADALQSAHLASHSGLISRAVEAAISQVLKGELVSQSLVFRQAFRPEWIESFSVGEQTGRIDAELARLAEESRKSGLARVERLAGWLPRFLGLLVLLGVGYGIVDWYRDYFGQISGLLDSP